MIVYMAFGCMISDSYQLSFQLQDLYILSYLSLCAERKTLSCISALCSECVAPKARGHDKEFLRTAI